MMRYVMGPMVLFLMMIYALVWVGCAAIDQNYCESKGLDYGHTAFNLDGYCSIDGLEVHAENFGGQ